MISISPGHYGARTGASGYIDEGLEAIKVAKRVTEILRGSDIKTNYIQDTVNKGQNVNVNWLVNQHNKSDRKVDCTIHFNSSSGTTSSGIGTEVLMYGEKTRKYSERLSLLISKNGNFKNRGAKIRTNLGMLARTNRPCYYIEVCFVNSKHDADNYFLRFELICRAIAQGLAESVGRSLSYNGGEEVVKNKPSVWAEKEWKKAVDNGIFDGTNPKGNMTREQMAVVLDRLGLNVKVK